MAPAPTLAGQLRRQAQPLPWQHVPPDPQLAAHAERVVVRLHAKVLGASDAPAKARLAPCCACSSSVLPAVLALARDGSGPAPCRAPPRSPTQSARGGHPAPKRALRPSTEQAPRRSCRRASDARLPMREPRHRCRVHASRVGADTPCARRGRYVRPAHPRHAPRSRRRARTQPRSTARRARPRARPAARRSPSATLPAPRRRARETSPPAASHHQQQEAEGDRPSPPLVGPCPACGAAHASAPSAAHSARPHLIPAR